MVARSRDVPNGWLSGVHAILCVCSSASASSSDSLALVWVPLATLLWAETGPEWSCKVKPALVSKPAEAVICLLVVMGGWLRNSSSFKYVRVAHKCKTEFFGNSWIYQRGTISDFLPSLHISCYLKKGLLVLTEKEWIRYPSSEWWEVWAVWLIRKIIRTPGSCLPVEETPTKYILSQSPLSCPDEIIHS